MNQNQVSDVDKAIKNKIALKQKVLKRLIHFSLFFSLINPLTIVTLIQQ
ncbi:hypothetical protein [Enterococcus ratti]|uniref:Uncharacterized protein n=1 Tax=Enterococcus ratti TaxID=150033 RepID=A0A1L8WHH9_9ENTE|nr:hypothetical protein [Enterococcus ratti]OJG80479.1 hypothetical protein RV14_GL000541 [Enterococcus ratti]